MSDIVDRLAVHEGRIVKVQGPARSGKTEVLVRRCAALLESGVDPESILVAVVSGFAAQSFKERLASCLGADRRNLCERVRVARPLDVCVEILDSPLARSVTGRIPRVLDEVEYRFLLEDLKTLGQKRGRLANMLAFFYAQWSKFEDEDAWLIPGEETSVLDYARRALDLYGAMMRHEVPYVCGKLLSSEEGRPLSQRYGYVLCDDFQDFSYAEQTCMCLCAATQVMVCGNPDAATEVNTEYPSPEGFRKFDRVRKGVESFELTTAHGIKDAVRFGESLFGREPAAVESLARSVEKERATVVEWQTPEEEFEGLVRAVRAFRSGCDGHLMVVVPTARWGHFAARALSRAGIGSSTAGLRLGLSGDPRTPGRHDALSAYLKLRLVADGTDALAWRAWGGLDNALTNSEMWKSVQSLALREGVGLYDAVRLVCEGAVDERSVLKSAELKRAWREGQEVIRACAGLRGMDLARATGAADMAEFAEALSGLGDEGASELCDRLRRAMTDPAFPEGHDVVRIALCESAVGVECSCMIVLGAVDGLMPSRDAFDVVESEEQRQRAQDADRRRLYACISRATDRLLVSSFRQAGMEVAERSRIQVARVTSRDGKRVALVSPSTFLRASSTLRIVRSDDAEGLRELLEG